MVAPWWRVADRTRWGLAAVASSIVAAGAAAVVAAGGQAPPGPPVLRVVAAIPLPGDSSRFDYASLDARRGLLFAVHLGASDMLEINVRTRRVVRVIPHLPQVHGVLVVPALHRVYATAAGVNEVARIEENSGQILGMPPTGAYPDGLAYDPANGTIWTTNEAGGSETIIDAATGAPRGSVRLGGQVGNVAYDPVSGRMLVAVQARDQLAVIDPTTRSITRRVPLPGCDHDHGLALDSANRQAFIACDGNAILLTLDLSSWRITGKATVGDQPDVLAYDSRAGRLYVAAESGWVTVLTRRGHRLKVTGSSHRPSGMPSAAAPTTHLTEAVPDSSLPLRRPRRRPVRTGWISRAGSQA